MGYIPPPPPQNLVALKTAFIENHGGSSDRLLLNVDRRGMPRDYATYVWLLYGKRVDDRSPARMAFLHGPRAVTGGWHHGSLGRTVLR